jgi:hypothetical protein
MTNRDTRRTFLSTVGAVGAASIAGCLTEAESVRDGENATDVGYGTTADGTATEPTGQNADVVDDFEDLALWATMTDEETLSPATDDAATGSQSARVEAGGDAEYAGVYRSFVGGADLRGQNLSLAVKLADPQLLDLTVQLLAPDVENVVTLGRTITGPTDRWVRVDLGVTAVEPDPDLGNVQEVRVMGRRRNSDGTPIEFQVDDLRAVPRPETGAVMFAFEASLESHYSTAYPIMQEYGFAGVETVIPEAVGGDGRLTVGEMRQMRDAGWDMAAHPRTGSDFLYEFSPEQQRGMIERTKTYLVNKGFPDGAKHFFTPKNVLGPNTLDIVAEFHEQAFRFGGAPNGLPISDPYNLGHFSGSAGDDTELFVDHAAEHGQLAVLKFGDVGGDGLSEDAFRGVLDHVQSRDVTVITATDLLER